MIKKLKNHPYAQCKVEIENDRIIFISKRTTVIFIINSDGVRHIECTGTYSATTRKQIGYFCKEYLPEYSYHDMKSIAGKGEIVM